MTYHIYTDASQTITLEQMEDLNWAVESIDVGDHVLETHDEAVSCDEDGEPILATQYQSYIHGLCTLRCVERPEVIYAIEWQANGDDETLAGAYDFTVEVNPNGFNEIDAGSLEILDEDGDVIRPDEAVHEIGNAIEMSIAWGHQVQKHLPKMPGPDSLDTDTDEDDTMETTELSRDDGPDVSFQGEEIASASSYHFEGSRNVRWTELTLYRTAGGKFVCHEVGRTIWNGERDRYAVHIADSAVALIESLGYGWLAKNLYEIAGIDHAEIVE